MRLIRSFFFGGLAMLAAVICLSMPASAFVRDPGICAVPLDPHLVDVLPEAAPSAVFAEAERMPAPSENLHAVAYVSQNQLFTSWRVAIDAYSRIDPHIAIG